MTQPPYYTIPSNQLPPASDLYDLGSADYEWRSLYLGSVGNIYWGLAQDAVLRRKAPIAGRDSEALLLARAAVAGANRGGLQVVRDKGAATGPGHAMELVTLYNGAVAADGASGLRFMVGTDLSTSYPLARIYGKSDGGAGGAGFLEFHTNSGGLAWDSASLAIRGHFDPNGNFGIGLPSQTAALRRLDLARLGAYGVISNEIGLVLRHMDDSNAVGESTIGMEFAFRSADYLNTNSKAIVRAARETAWAANVGLAFLTAAGGAPSEKMRITADGKMGIGVYPDNSAKLQVDSTSRGFAPPRMTTAQKAAIGAPIPGLVVYDSTLGKLCIRGAAGWETVTSV